MSYRKVLRYGHVRLWVLTCSLLGIGAAYSEVVEIPVKSGVDLKPEATYAVRLETSEPLELGWKAVQAKPCSTNCVQATEMTGPNHYSIATSLGASQKYMPIAGKILVEYKNVSNEPVTINVYKVLRTCEAEACRFLDAKQQGQWLVFKVDEFKSITTSKDGSYSVISGVTTTGRPFSFKAVWWTDDKAALMVNCAPSVQKYLDNHVPKEKYSPYVISGQSIGEAANVVLKSIDTCAADAPHFGVPEDHVFK
jgi:hypothetical protein